VNKCGPGHCEARLSNYQCSSCCCSSSSSSSALSLASVLSTLHCSRLEQGVRGAHKTPPRGTCTSRQRNNMHNPTAPLGPVTPHHLKAGPACTLYSSAQYVMCDAAAAHFTPHLCQAQAQASQQPTSPRISVPSARKVSQRKPQTSPPSGQHAGRNNSAQRNNNNSTQQSSEVWSGPCVHNNLPVHLGVHLGV
jgi:hypothetical protein